jgi:hypothetical protein
MLSHTMMFRALLPLLALIPACVPIPVPPGTPGAIQISAGDPCGSEDLQTFVDQPAAALEGVTFESPVPVRVIRPGDAVTEDHDPERLNFRIGPDDRVASVDCG